MLKLQLKYLLIILCSLTLISCASIPTHIDIKPQLDLKTTAYRFNNQQAWQVSSQDLRVARHLIEIIDGDNVAQLVNEQQSLRLLIENNLTQTWLNNGLKVDDESAYKIDIQLIKALTTVIEPIISYDVETQMIIKVQLTHKNKVFVRLFRSNHQWEAPFATNIDRITKELNIQLSQLLNQIIQDPELNAKLQQF